MQTFSQKVFLICFIYIETFDSENIENEWKIAFAGNSINCCENQCRNESICLGILDGKL
jgi:hypothetical protein